MKRFHLTIDRVVLPANAGGDPKIIVNALREELTRQFSDPGVQRAFSQSQRTPIVKLGRAILAPGAEGSRRFGVALARGISRGPKR